jgi:DNA-binding NtrC family response regulator
MSSSITKSRSLIAVDDDLRVLDQISSALDSTHVVLATSDVRRAIAWLQNDVTVSAILVSQTLRGSNAMDLLENALKLRPEARRILIANYDDLSSIVSALHSGIVQRTIAKPINPRELIALVRTPPIVSGGKHPRQSATA